jgi:hypothetical protein
MWEVGQGRKENFNTQYTLPSRAEETVIGTREQEGLLAGSKSNIRADYGQRQR